MGEMEEMQSRVTGEWRELMLLATMWIFRNGLRSLKSGWMVEKLQLAHSYTYPVCNHDRDREMNA